MYLGGIRVYKCCGHHVCDVMESFYELSVSIERFVANE